MGSLEGVGGSGGVLEKTTGVYKERVCKERVCKERVCKVRVCKVRVILIPLKLFCLW